MKANNTPEVIESIELSKLHPFPDHPFAVRDDDTMQQTVESIKQYGVLVPAIARPREDGGYELIAGHRRKYACELAGLKTMPVIIRNVDRIAATIIMVDSNLQRENILPSERAKAYKMKLDAIKQQGARHDLTSVQPGQKLVRKSSRDLIAENSPDSSTQIQRYTLKELNQSLGKETIDTFNTGESRGREISHSLNYQKLGKDLATVDELAVLDGGKCILQLRGVRPFMSNKYDITKHPNYKYLSDASDKNYFDIEKYLSTHLKTKPEDVYEVFEVDASDEVATA